MGRGPGSADTQVSLTAHGAQDTPDLREGKSSRAGQSPGGTQLGHAAVPRGFPEWFQAPAQALPDPGPGLAAQPRVPASDPVLLRSPVDPLLGGSYVLVTQAANSGVFAKGNGGAWPLPAPFCPPGRSHRWYVPRFY